MSKTTFWSIVAFLVLCAGLVAYEKQEHVFNKLPPNYIWNFSDKGTDDTGVPHSGVTLLVNGSKYDLGTVDGSCTTIDSGNWNFLEGEESGVICYFAGGGTEFGVFNENGQRTIKKGFLDEGDAETAATRGNFETVATLAN